MLAADRIKRLNRLYAVSSGINEAIVRVPQVSRLYLEACRIAVERGAFQMAWIGIEETEQRVLVPVARWGRDEGYVDSIRITTNPQSREGLGPGGTAFRSGAAAVCNDIEADTQFFAFRREALAHGFRSCAAFPLKRQDRPFAVFFVYAAEPLYFDEQELALLTSLADNFSFAIESREKDAERGHIYAALRASESRLRAVVDNEPACVKVLSVDGTVLDMNPAGLALLKAPSAPAVIGHNVFDFILAADRDAYRQMHERVLSGQASQLQARAVDLEGNTLWMDTHAVPLRSGSGDVTSVLCLTRDVTQERASLDKLQHQKSLLSIASRLGRIGAAAIDVPSMAIKWSDDLAALHEMPAGFSPTNETALGFYPPEFRQRVVEIFRACASDGNPFDVEVEILTQSQRRIPVRCIGEAERDATGRIVRVQGAFQDITTQLEAQREILSLNVELEERVRHRTAQLEMANRELEAFSYSVAHDLRAPLMAIGGFSQALAAELGAVASDRVRHYLSRMREGVQRTSEMIDALLSLANLARTELRWERVDMSALAERAGENCRGDTGPPIELLIQPGITGYGDPRLLQLVMDNLIGNACKFSSKQAAPRVEVVMQTSPEGETTIEVRDNGVGFDMAYAANLFGAFQRLHPPGEFPGTGIGLANVRRIISRHSGRVWAHSSPGAGAAFYFTLGPTPA